MKEQVKGEKVQMKSTEEKEFPGYGWLLFCVLGLLGSLTLYGLVLEYVTTGGRKLDELSFLFITTFIYAITAYNASKFFGEKKTDISKYNMLILSVTSLTSTFTSVRSLRYVIYPVQILFKSCKAVPVMFFGVMLGKNYPLKKYINVLIITLGVCLFMGAGNAANSSSSSPDSMILGGIMLSISLCFDGATGAYEDKLMGTEHVEPFDLMYNIQLGKAILSFIALVLYDGMGGFLRTISEGDVSLFLLGLSGALGQIFIFFTISKFGALNCSLIGLFRKILSLLLSFITYGHTVNSFQTLGLILSLSAMIANFYKKRGGEKKSKEPYEGEEIDDVEKNRLLDDQDNEEEQEVNDSNIRSAAAAAAVDKVVIVDKHKASVNVDYNHLPPVAATTDQTGKSRSKPKREAPPLPSKTMNAADTNANKNNLIDFNEDDDAVLGSDSGIALSDLIDTNGTKDRVTDNSDIEPGSPYFLPSK